MFLMQVKRCA
jgi:hypothetical protein